VNNGEPIIVYVGVDNNVYFISENGEEQLTCLISSDHS